MIKVRITAYWDYDEFLVPIDTTKPDQFKREMNRSDKILPAGHRCRGDVGTV